MTLALLLMGCATNRVDWNARMGSYTFDQAVLEMGPPDKQAKLQDGTVVAEWITRRGSNRGYVSGPFYHSPGPGPFYGGYYTESSPDYFLRLTFDPNGKLTASKKFAR
jgi:hypothetical protein